MQAFFGNLPFFSHLNKNILLISCILDIAIPGKIWYTIVTTKEVQSNGKVSYRLWYKDKQSTRDLNRIGRRDIESGPSDESQCVVERSRSRNYVSFAKELRRKPKETNRIPIKKRGTVQWQSKLPALIQKQREVRSNGKVDYRLWFRSKKEVQSNSKVDYRLWYRNKKRYSPMAKWTTGFDTEASGTREDLNRIGMKRDIESDPSTGADMLSWDQSHKPTRLL